MISIVRDCWKIAWREGLWAWPLIYLGFATLMVRPVSDLSMGAAHRGAVGTELLLLWCVVAASALWLSSRLVGRPVWNGSASLLWLRAPPRHWVVAVGLAQGAALLGLIAVLFLGTTVLHLVLGLPLPPPGGLAWWWALTLEGGLICALSTAFSVLIRPALAPVCTTGMVIVGHWMDAFRTFVVAEGGLASIGWLAVLAVPDLSRFDLAGPVLHGVSTSGLALAGLTAYAGAWIVALAGATVLILQSRDLT